MDLSTNYLGLRLSSPLMPGASPLGDELDTVKKLEDAGTAAIAGKPKEKHVIDPALCIACGACFDVCPEDAIRFLPKHEGGGHAPAGH